MLRYLTAGESHGQALVVIVEGLPAGLPITVEEIQAEMARRRLGYGRGPRQTLRAGRADACSAACATAARSARRWPSRSRTASGSAATSGTRRCRRRPASTKEPLTQVRPGHADLVGMQKYGFTDARDVLERASARETAARVAAGAVAKKLLGRARRRRSCPTSSRWDGVAIEGGRAPDASPIWTASTSRRCAASTPPPRRR